LGHRGYGLPDQEHFIQMIRPIFGKIATLYLNLREKNYQVSNLEVHIHTWNMTDASTYKYRIRRKLMEPLKSRAQRYGIKKSVSGLKVN
jgi:hypothetical protein